MTQATAIASLPLVECPLAAGTPATDTLAIFFSGDGGWARFDRSIANRLVAAGIPVVGWSAFRYFWRQRTPDSVAADLAQVIEAYGNAWQCRRVVLVGFSRGADVLPFAYNRLAAEPQSSVVQITLLGLAAQVAFEYRLLNWLGLAGPPPGLNVLAELRRLPVQRSLCINGAEDPQAVLPAVLTQIGLDARSWPGGHHIGHAHERIARLILQQALPGTG